MTKKNLFLIFLIIVITLTSRLSNLGANPKILNRDEAALGYNAYLLKTTGGDEWGKKWPLALESFGDYKLIGYPLAAIPFISILPFSDFAVRLPSALAGILLVIISYFFAKKYFNSTTYALLFSLSIACTPVFIFYSRMAYEANLALTYLIGAIYFLFLSDIKSVKKYITAFILLLLACVTYNTPLLLLPFFIPAIILFSGLKKYKIWLVPVTITAVLFFSIFFSLNQLLAQKSGITIFQDERLILASNDYYFSFPEALRPILGNKLIFFTPEILKRFISTFSPNFLVLKGGTHPWHTLPQWGNVYLISYGLVMLFFISILYKGMQLLKLSMRNFKKNTLAIYLLTNAKYLKKNLEGNKFFTLLYLLCISVIPSSVTTDSPHTTRSLLFFYFFILFSICGLQWLQQQVYKGNMLLYLYTIVLLVSTTTYTLAYTYDYPKVQNKLFQSDYKQVITTIKENQNTQIAVVDGSGYLYILTAWYLQLDANSFLSSVVRQNPDRIGFRYGEKVSNVHFIANKDDIFKTNEKLLIYLEPPTWKIEER